MVEVKHWVAVPYEPYKWTGGAKWSPYGIKVFHSKEVADQWLEEKKAQKGFYPGEGYEIFEVSEKLPHG